MSGYQFLADLLPLFITAGLALVIFVVTAIGVTFGFLYLLWWLYDTSHKRWEQRICSEYTHGSTNKGRKW